MSATAEQANGHADVAVALGDTELEENVLGAMLVTAKALDAVLGGTELDAEDFARPRHRTIFAAIGDLASRGEPVDALTVADELAKGGKLDDIGGREVLDRLVGATAVPGNAGHYARRVAEKAVWRRRVAASQAILAACKSEDGTALAEAEAMLRAGEADSDREYDVDRLTEIVLEMARGNHEPPLPWVYERLNQLRPIRRGNFIVLSGHSHFGKSWLADAVLDHLARKQYRVHLYPNEMDADERVARTIMRRLKIPTQRLEQGRLQGNEFELLERHLREEGLGWGMTNIAGWSAARVAQHIIRSRWDLCVVDILHNFDYHDERDLTEIINQLANAAKVAHTAVVLVAHVNRNRTAAGISPVKPRPTGADLKGSGSIYNRADIVCFVHREQDEETGEPLEDAEIFLDKARGGQLGGFKARFDEERGRFLPKDRFQ